MKKSFPVPTGRWWGLILIPLAVGLVTLFGVSLSRPVGSLSHIFIYLLVIMVAAVWWDVKIAIYAAFLSVLAIIYFFVPPRGSFFTRVEDYSYTSEMLGLVFFLILSVFITYLISALRRERDRAQKLARLEREAKEAVVKASEKLERQRQRAVYLQQARQLLTDTIEPQEILPKVLDDLVAYTGGQVVVTFETNHSDSDGSGPKPVAARKLSAPPGYVPSPRRPAPDLDLPLRVGGQLLGHLTYFYDEVKGYLPAEDTETINSTVTALAGYIAISLENSKLYQALEFQNNEIAQLLKSSLRADTALSKRVEQLSIFYRLSAAVISGVDRKMLMSLGLSEVARVIKCSVGVVMLFDPQRQTLRVEARRGELQLKEGSGVPLKGAIASQVILQRQPYMCNSRASFETSSDNFDLLGGKSHPVHSCLYLPIASETETFGLLAIGAEEPNQYKSEDQDFLVGLSGLLTMAMVSQRYYEERERAASEEERNRIARELHDGLAQSINYIGLKTQLVQELYQAGEYDQVQEEIERIARVAELARMDVREALYGLRHTNRDRSIYEAMTDLVHQAAELSGIGVSLKADNHQSWPVLTLAEQIQLLRIVQEALSNIQKHSQATQAQVEVAFESKEGYFKLVITDNGRGFVPETVKSNGSKHLGLSIMRERAIKIGAHLQISSQPAQGTTVEVVYTPTNKENPVLVSEQPA